MRAIVDSVTSVTGRPEPPEQVRHALEGATMRVFGPIDAVFSVLEESGAMMRRQAEALATAGRALEEAASVMKAQAELFERTIGVTRKPVDAARSVTGASRPRGSRTGQSPRHQPDA